MTDKELDDLFQKTLSAHQMPVPTDMWQRVNPQKEKKRRGALVWWSVLGVAALLVLVGTATWLYQGSGDKSLASTTSVQRRDTAPAETQTSVSRQPMPSAETQPESSAVGNPVSSQSKEMDKSSQNRQPDLYASQSTGRSQSSMVLKNHDLIPHSAEATNKENTNDNKIARDNKQASSEVSTSTFNSQLPEPTVSSTLNDAPVATSDQAGTALQKTDSSLAVAEARAEKKTAAQAIKIKKLRGDKAASLELMVAAYDSKRNVYEALKTEEPGIVAFGPIDTKEKVYIHGFSLNVRVDKPLTSHFSLKTGLQFLQMHQRVSYRYETVSQSTIVSSFNIGDTLRFARLQTERPVVKGIYNSLHVPLLLNYHTNGTKIDLGITGGVMINVLSWYSGSVPDAGYKQTIPAKDAFRTRTGASLYAGVTVAKRLGNFQLFAEPHIQYTLSSITKSQTSFRQKTTGYGLGIGLRKTLRK